jgi:hypothetical protein
MGSRRVPRILGWQTEKVENLIYPTVHVHNGICGRTVITDVAWRTLLSSLPFFSWHKSRLLEHEILYRKLGSFIAS